MFCTKKIVHDKWAILGLTMANPRKSGSALRIFFKFCRMTGANRQMRMILIIFRKKVVWGKWTIMGAKMVHPYNSGSALRIFLNFAQ